MDQELPEEPTAPSRAVRMPGAPDAGQGIGVYPLFLHVLVVAAKNLPTLSAIYLPTALIASAIMFLGAPSIADPPVDQTTYDVPANEWIVMAGLVLFLLSFGAWSSAALMRSAHAALTQGRALPFGAAYGSAIERVPSYVATQFLYGLMVGLGACACIVPGIWAAVAFAPALPRAATRAVGPIQALREGLALSRGRRWRIFGFWTLCVMAIYALMIPILAARFVLPEGGGAPLVLKMILNAISTVVVGVVQITAYAALHERLEETAG